MQPSTAHRLLNDPEFKELMEEFRRVVFREFAQTEPTDTANLTACRMRLDALDWMQGRLTNLAHDFTRQTKKE